jgi:hypothetical protein
MKLSPFVLSALAAPALATECLTEEYDSDPIGIPAADLSRVFQPYGFNFVHKLTNMVVSPAWATGIDDLKFEKMQATHRGDYSALNVWMIEGGQSGVCDLPQAAGNTITQGILDGSGCHVPLTGPNSKEAGVMVHEIGHWLGLLHTFQGGCSGDGDYCGDTAPQNGPSYGKLAVAGDKNSCPATESCGAGKGLQNVKNFVSGYPFSVWLKANGNTDGLFRLRTRVLSLPDDEDELLVVEFEERQGSWPGCSDSWSLRI